MGQVPLTAQCEFQVPKRNMLSAQLFLVFETLSNIDFQGGESYFSN